MDLLILIKEKCEAFRSASFYSGLTAVALHIEVAQRHFEKAKETSDFLYTDVIYRTNQAFEGALKEAYGVYTGMDSSAKSPFEIERHLEIHKLLKPRVLSQLRNYRTEWRNKATHDYQLFFSSQEALLAIVSVSAFFVILLDQMMEKYAYETEKRRLSKANADLFTYRPGYGSMDFLQQCAMLISNFSQEIRKESSKEIPFIEVEILGRLAAFIAATDSSIRAEIDQQNFVDGRKLEIDLVLKKDGHTVIVEIKREGSDASRRMREALLQLRGKLSITGVSDGILFLLPSTVDSLINLSRKTELIDGTSKNILLIGSLKFI